MNDQFTALFSHSRYLQLAPGELSEDEKHLLCKSANPVQLLPIHQPSTCGFVTLPISLLARCVAVVDVWRVAIDDWR